MDKRKYMIKEILRNMKLVNPILRDVESHTELIFKRTDLYSMEDFTIGLQDEISYTDWPEISCDTILHFIARNVDTFNPYVLLYLIMFV